MSNIPTFFITNSQFFNEINEAFTKYPNDADLGRAVKAIIIKQKEEIKNRAKKN